MNNFKLKFISINSHIDIIYTRIHDIVETLLPGNNTSNYATSKNLLLAGILKERKLFSSLEIDKFKRFKSFKRQIEWIAGRITIKSLLSKKLDLDILMSSIYIDTRSDGSPYLPEYPDLSISISHSNDVAASVISFKKNSPIGIDLEKIKKIENRDDFLKVAFNDIELSAIREKSDQEVYNHWTVKEAYLKYIKKGFNENLKKVSFIDDDIFHDGLLVSNVSIETRKIEEDYVMSLVYKNIQNS